MYDTEVTPFFNFLKENKSILENLDINDLSLETVENKLVPLARENGFDITAKDIFMFINEKAAESVSMVDDDILDQVAGGRGNFNKVIATSLLALIGLTTLTNDNQVRASQMESSVMHASEAKYARLVGENNITINNVENAIRIQDDFYNSVNREWIKNTKIPDGKPWNNTFNQVHELNQKNILDILKELSSKQNKKGSPEQRLSDFYKSATDLENREKQGATPIKKYMDLYDNSENLDELLKADILTFKETGISNFLSTAVTADAKNSDKYILNIGSLTTYFPKHTIDSEQASTAYKECVKKLLELSGENSEQADIDALNTVKLEKDIAEASLEQNELYDVDKTYNTFSVDELDQTHPNLHVKDTLSKMGYTDVDIVNIADTNRFNKACEYFEKKDIDTLKLYAKTRILLNCCECLSKDFTDTIENLNKALFGVEGQMPLEEKATLSVSSMLPNDLGKIFVKKYFSEDAKKDVENMISKIKTNYKNKIKKANWLSGQTKEKALKKLDTMKLKIGYPEQWNDTPEYVDIRSYEDGGSYFSNICEVVKELVSRGPEALKNPVDKTKWAMAVYDVNAYYDPQNNEIVFPAGILQSPFYDVNASDEKNMGGIGAIIAHEISHAFDCVGSKFDENGNAVNWWTDEDRENFNKRCEKFIAAYDGLEILKDIKSNGNLTLFENIADVGAISCMLDILSQKENADYQAFFKSWATVWRAVASYEFTNQLNNFDVHSNSKIRTNRTLANFEEFYKTFNINQNDKMYVSPENRVSLW